MLDTAVWYEDGNIVLIAGKTVFRLYKGVLASVSPVFKDMFSWAKPNVVSENSTIDGCPVIRLADSPTDLRHFLIMITTGFVELLDCTSLVSFSRLAATIRIAHKYQAERILKAAASRLRRFFTANVIAELHAQIVTHKTWQSFWNQKQQDIARLLGYDDMLPFALLLCCAADPLLLRNGVQREDGTISKLSDEDYLECIRAIPALVTRTLHMLGVETMHKCARTAPVKGCGCKNVLVAMGNAYLKEPFSGALADGFVWFRWRNSTPKAYADREQALCDKCFLRLMKTFDETFSDLKLEVVEKKTGYYIYQLTVGVAK
ncbi:hypothetical protein LXA43DRAFT_1105016 [Ganoderma leucocontextum]|nr:hypothetical protein LXA43DRAFT_1105016 [Ganoderma leucocontextum]